MLSRISQKKSKNHDFTYMWDIKLKATNKQTRKIKSHRHRQ